MTTRRTYIADAAPISVVIPAYNAESTLAVCVESVLEQSVSPAEIIVVDDGSTDQTELVARGFTESVTVVQQENQGSAVARQIGTQIASERFIAYLDADDWWPESTIATYIEVLKAHEVDFLVADFVRAVPGSPPCAYLPRNTTFFPWFRECLRSHGESLGLTHLFRLAPDKALGALLRGFPYFPSSSLVRREAVLDAGGWDRRFRRCQDFDLALRLTRRCPLYFLDAVQAIVGINEGNRDADAYVIQQTSGDLLVLEAHFQDNENDPLYQALVSRGIARRYYNLGVTYRRIGHRRAAFSAFRSSLRWPGKRLKSFIRMVSI